MAGDWIKWSVGLLKKPEVVRISAQLSTTREVVVCRLMEFWEWCDANIPDNAIRECGTAFVKMSPSDGDNMAFLDALVCTPKFSVSLAAVEWIAFRNGHIEIPNFGRHNGETAKTRARNAKNQDRKRSSGKDVTKMSPRDGDKTVTRGEKRRVSSPSISASDVVIPEKMQTAEVQQAANMWFSHLDVCAPDKLPVRGSPQEQAFWLDAARFGPTNFIRSVEYCVARGWKNLRPVDEPDVKGGMNGANGRRKARTAQDREDANANAFGELAAAYGLEGDAQPG